MKKIINSIAILSLLMTSCVNDAPDFNENKDRAYTVPAEALLTNSEKALVDIMTSPNVNDWSLGKYFPQYWAAVTYTTESRYRVTSRKIPDRMWRILYADVIGNLESAKGVIQTETAPTGVPDSQFQSEQKNKIAIIDILQVYTYQILVDMFGDVPYTESLQPSKFVLPKYDSGKSIYTALITRLNADIAALNSSNDSFKSGEYIYNGDVANWKLFANSLKVKIGVNLIETDAPLAKSTIESAFTAGLILDNSKNASFAYVTAAPNYNPIYDNLVAANRNDFIPASTIVNEMNTLNDPRRSKYFTPLADGSFLGGKYGFTNKYTSFSHVSDLLKSPDFPSQLLEASEINFYLAEAAAAGLSVGNTTEFYYNNAITASFISWGIGEDAPAYLLNPNVAFTTAPGATAKEKIAKQEWIAFYNRGMESWTAYRRLNFPVLVAPTSAYAEAENEVPKRLTYPINEQTVNGDNWQAASTAIGGDKLKTHVFWDKL
ncbi:MAG: SusD/RagB family nutrient-binding outer membrane lipoprotein [Flavobacterium sp.]|nr:SusD/RagB family nutrient-binding outer membrane lipoprotein [Flavobacterium sp.]